MMSFHSKSPSQVKKKDRLKNEGGYEVDSGGDDGFKWGVGGCWWI